MGLDTNMIKGFIEGHVIDIFAGGATAGVLKNNKEKKYFVDFYLGKV